jgi:hypothetical protein
LRYFGCRLHDYRHFNRNFYHFRGRFLYRQRCNGCSFGAGRCRFNDWRWRCNNFSQGSYRHDKRRQFLRFNAWLRIGIGSRLDIVLAFRTCFAALTATAATTTAATTTVLVIGSTVCNRCGVCSSLSRYLVFRSNSLLRFLVAIRARFTRLALTPWFTRLALAIFACSILRATFFRFLRLTRFACFAWLARLFRVPAFATFTCLVVATATTATTTATPIALTITIPVTILTGATFFGFIDWFGSWLGGLVATEPREYLGNDPGI